MPAGLRRAHRVARGTWGRIVVHHGQLRFLARTEPELVVVVGPGLTQAIPPEIEHEVQPMGPVSFSIDFLSVREPEPELVIVGDEGGEPACWAHLLCPDCGVVLNGGSHLNGCRSGANT